MLKCHEYGITGYGNSNADIMFIGIAPAKNEMQTGKPFAGPSGKLLDSLLASSNISREDVYTTNLICWRTMDGTHNRDPYPAEITACAPRLIAEILTIKPKLIVGLGDLVAEQFITTRAFSRSALHRVAIHGHECWFMYTYHPAAALREGNESKDKYIITNTICNDFAKLPNIVDTPPFDKPDYEVASVELAQEVLDWLSKSQELANIDVETGAAEDEIDNTNSRIGCISITPLCTRSSIIIKEELIKQLTWHEDIRWITHYGLFDVQVLAHYGVKIVIHEDTCLMDYNVNENRLHRVKNCGHEFVGAPFYEDAMKPYKKNYLSAPPEVLYQYNTYDTVVSNRVFNYLRPLQDEGQRNVYEKILIPAANVFAQVQHRGIRISKDAMRELLKQWYPEQQALIKELDVMTGGINLNSNQQLSKYVYSDLKMPGGPSVDKNDILRLRDKHPFFDKLSRYRKLSKMIGTYIVGIYDDIKEDGLLHPVILLHGADTGRPSYVNPPSQTLPGPNSREGGDEFGQIKSIFVPMDDDHILCEADYSSAEFYTAAAHSQDDVMLSDLTTTDFHRNTASILFNKEMDQVSGQERSTGKTWNFRMFYALDHFGAAQHFNVHPEIAKEWHNSFFTKYHKFAEWRLLQKRRLLDDGEIRTFHGRVRHFPLVISQKMLRRYWRMAINDGIQADAVDCILLSAIELHPLLAEYDSYIILEVHDSLLFDLNKQYLDITIPLIREVMTKSKHERMLVMPPVDIKVGSNWYDMRTYG